MKIEIGRYGSKIAVATEDVAELVAVMANSHDELEKKLEESVERIAELEAELEELKAHEGSDG